MDNYFHFKKKSFVLNANEVAYIIEIKPQQN
jgi:hypothetical protein